MAQRVETTDELAVLSMHQPWASLLVHGNKQQTPPCPPASDHNCVLTARSIPWWPMTGIKRIEGRTWSTKHRGRLWIHATSATPSPDDIQVGA